MLDIGWSELLVVVIVAIVVVGPKDLPKLMRTLGIYAGKLRRAAGDFQRQFDEAMAESEADEVAKNIEAIRANMGTTADFGMPPDKPLMTRATPHSIEQAIAPQGKRDAKRRSPVKKTPAKRRSPAKKKHAKRKAAAKPKAKSRATNKTAAKRKTATKKTTRRTATRTATRTRKGAKTRPKR